MACRNDRLGALARRAAIGAHGALLGALLWGAAGAAALADEAARLVTIGSDVTEIVFALGAGDDIVAVDSTSLYPEAATRLPDLGYLRQLSAEPIIAMAPTLVLVSEEAGPPPVFDQLEATQVPVLRVTDEPSPAGLDEKVRTIGEALGLEAEATALRARLATEFEELAARTEAAADHPRVLLMISIGQGRLMAAGEDSSGERIIELAGGVNAVQGFAGYKPLSAEAAIAAAPDVIVVPSHAYELLGGTEGIVAMPQLAPTPAARAGRVVSIDSLLLLGFGPRLAEGAGLLADALETKGSDGAAPRILN